MKTTQHSHCEGQVLIMALALLFALSSLLSYTSLAVRTSYKLEHHASHISSLQRALDAGVAIARSKIQSSGSERLRFQDSLGSVSFRVVGNPLNDTKYRIRVFAENSRGPTAQCTVVVQIEGQEPHYSSRLVKYTQSRATDTTG